MGINEERTVTQNQRVDDLGSTDLSTSFISSSTETKKNDRDIDSEDPDATSKKKLKINEDILYGNETVKEEENDYEMDNKDDETKHHIISPVSKTVGTSHETDLVKKMQTMNVYFNTLLEMDHAVTPLITTCCCLGLITTQRADKEPSFLKRMNCVSEI